MKPDQYICDVIITSDYKFQKNGDAFDTFLENLPTVTYNSISEYKRMAKIGRKYTYYIEFEMESDNLDILIVDVNKLKDYLMRNVESFCIDCDVHANYTNLSWSLTNYKN